MPFTILEPEVAGGWGPSTVVDRSIHPPRVQRLHYEFNGWLGDEFLESFPCFIVSAALASKLSASSLRGFGLDDVLVTASSEFVERHPTVVLPAFRWLKITGRAGSDDFGLSVQNLLVVSTEALAVLETFPLAHAERRVFAP